MTTKGPWIEDAMWTPDESPKSTPKLVREHYFIVSAQVMSDGTHRFVVDPEAHVNPDEPIYYPDIQEWDRVTPDVSDEDTHLHLDLTQRLG